MNPIAERRAHSFGTLTPPVRPLRYRWQDILDMVLSHRRQLTIAHIMAILTALISVPVPLLMPLLVDEVLLHKPGPAVAAMNEVFPPAWHGPVLYILAMLAFTLLLRLVSVLLTVLQARRFTAIAKDVSYRLRKELVLSLIHI